MTERREGFRRVRREELIDYLSTNHDHASVRSPSNGQSFSSKLHHSSAGLVSHIPKSAGTVARDRG